MKRLALAISILAGNFILLSSSYADDLAMAATLSAVPHMILNGEVMSVSRADSKQGTESEIVVIDTTNKVIHVLVTSTTTLWDADAKAIMLDKIAPKSRVNVIYLTTDEGINIGKSVKVVGAI